MATRKRKSLTTDPNKESARKKSTEELDAAWEEIGSQTKDGFPPALLLNGPGIAGSSKIAGFDLDYTLIRPKSGRKWPTGATDWQLMDDKIKTKLQTVHRDGYKVVIFTNQRGIEKKHTDINDFKKKCKDIILTMAIPIQVLVSTGESHFRKPSTTLWDVMTQNNEGIAVDLTQSFYVGDAAGRPKAWAPGKPKDFSTSDRMFAANVGVRFLTPEEYFFDEDPCEFEWRSINPQDYLETGKKTVNIVGKIKEMIIMVGPPACGKSAFYKKQFEPQGYERVNQDTLKTQAKCLAVARDAIKNERSFVIDNTNPSASTREVYINAAKQKGYGIRCIIMDVPLELAKHLNYVRQNYTKSGVRRIPNVAYNMFKKNYEEPKKSEGIDEILRLPFEPFFQDDFHKKLFLQWTDY